MKNAEVTDTEAQRHREKNFMLYAFCLCHFVPFKNFDI
jgi:hypothetical protein